MLKAALAALKKHGAKIVEAYPVVPKDPRKPIPPAFAWTGVLKMFLENGFESVDQKEHGKKRVRRTL